MVLLHEIGMGLATAHADLGTVTEIGALYILLAAATNILPRRFRMTRYKQRMRSVLVLWWLVLLLGLATYVRWYTQCGASLGVLFDGLGGDADFLWCFG